MSLAENLRQSRERNGFTLEEVAESVNVTREAVRKYEQGAIIPNGVVLVYLAEKLGVTCEELVKGKIENLEN